MGRFIVLVIGIVAFLGALFLGASWVADKLGLTSSVQEARYAAEVAQVDAEARIAEAQADADARAAEAYAEANRQISQAYAETTGKVSALASENSALAQKLVDTQRGNNLFLAGFGAFMLLIGCLIMGFGYAIGKQAGSRTDYYPPTLPDVYCYPPRQITPPAYYIDLPPGEQQPYYLPLEAPKNRQSRRK